MGTISLNWTEHKHLCKENTHTHSKVEKCVFWTDMAALIRSGRSKSCSKGSQRWTCWNTHTHYHPNVNIDKSKVHASSIKYFTWAFLFCYFAFLVWFHDNEVSECESELIHQSFFVGIVVCHNNQHLDLPTNLYYLFCMQTWQYTWAI